MMIVKKRKDMRNIKKFNEYIVESINYDDIIIYDDFYHDHDGLSEYLDTLIGKTISFYSSYDNEFNNDVILKDFELDFGEDNDMFHIFLTYSIDGEIIDKLLNIHKKIIVK